MPKERRRFSDEEISILKGLIANKASKQSMTKALHCSINTLNKNIKELQVLGVLPPINKGGGVVPPPKTEDDDDDDEEKEEPLVKPTRDMFILKAKQVLSDSMVKDLKERLSAAQVLKDAEYLYRKNIENIGFRWDQWVQKALQRLYDDTLEWYEEEGSKMSLEDIMEIATEMETAKAFVEGSEV